ncbi:hypothetical protein Z949_618 [Sulfitobacter guttiformis KCTC 32187]|nr:hypothetical protein Z949_618 [Sulfitobacter guttiformis KCTC 32187]
MPSSKRCIASFALPQFIHPHHFQAETSANEMLGIMPS